MAEADKSQSRLATAESDLADPALVDGQHGAMAGASAEEESLPQADCPEGPASFKGQMAARYKERQSMGYHVTSGENQTGDAASPTNTERDNHQTAMRGNPASAVELGERGGIAQADLPKHSKSIDAQGSASARPEDHGGRRVAVDTRRSMRDLITQFERRSNTTVDSFQSGQRTPTPTGESCRDSKVDTDKRVNGGLAREAWRGSNRAFHMDLDTAAITSSSSSVSMSEETIDTETCSLRGSKGNESRTKGRKCMRILRSASSTDLEMTGFGVSGGAGRKEAGNEKGQFIHDGSALKMNAGTGKKDMEIGVPVITSKMKFTGHGGDQAITETQGSTELKPKTSDKKIVECEVGQPEHKEYDSTKTQATDTETKDSEVPQPLRVNLKDFAARKKRSSNTGDMKYVVHRKDWNKWMQTHQRQRQTGGLEDTSNPLKSTSREPIRKSALGFKILQKNISREPKIESNRLSRKPSRRKLITSASNTQQRLETRTSQRTTALSPGREAMSAGLANRSDGGPKKPSSAMERYQMFLNRTHGHRQDEKTNNTQVQPGESKSPRNSRSPPVPVRQAPELGKSEKERSGSQTSVPFPELSVPPLALSPSRRKEGSRQALQELLKKAREKDARQRPVHHHTTSEERGPHGTLSHKPEVSDVVTVSTGSFISNANTTSTMELERQMDRVLAQLEEVTAAKALKNKALDTSIQRQKDHASVIGQSAKDLNKALEAKWMEQPLSSLSRMSPTSKMLHNVTGKPNTTLTRNFAGNVKGYAGQASLDLPLNQHDLLYGKYQQTVTPNNEYLQQLSLHSTSPVMRKQYGTYSVRQSRSRSSPASVRQAAQASDTSSRKLEQQLALQSVLLEKTNRAISDRRLFTDQIQSHFTRHRSSSAAKPKLSPSLDIQAVTRSGLSGAGNPYTYTENLSESGITSNVISGRLSPTSMKAVSTGQPSSRAYQPSFSSSPRQVESPVRGFRKPGKPIKDNTLPSPVKSGAKTEMSSEDVPKMAHEEPNTALEKTTHPELSRDFTRPGRRGAFTNESRPTPMNARKFLESIQPKTNASVYQAARTRPAAKSKSIHYGGWQKPEALLTNNVRNKSHRILHMYNDDSSIKTGYTREFPILATEATAETNFQNERQCLPTRDNMKHDKLPATLARPNKIFASPRPTSSSTKAPGFSPQSKRPPSRSPKPGLSRQASPTKQAFNEVTTHLPGQHYPPVQRRASSNLVAATKTWSATSMANRKAGAARHHDTRDDHRRRRLRENSVDDATTVTSFAASGVRTLSSVSRVDQYHHTVRRTVMTPPFAAHTEGGQAKSRAGPVTAAVEYHSREKMTIIIPGEGTEKQSRPSEEKKPSPTQLIIKSREVTSLRGDPLDGWTAREETDQVSQDLEDKVFCHFGSNELINVQDSKVPPEDGQKDTSSPESSAKKRKRKVSEKMKKIKKKRKGKREGEKLALKEEQNSLDMSPERVIKRKNSAEISPKGTGTTGSRKGSPESNHTVGVTSEQLITHYIAFFLCLSENSTRMMRALGLPRYRPVTRLTNKPTAMFPSHSHIPLRMDSPCFLANRKRLDLLAQYRRWREGMVDPDHPSKIPLSIGFRWTLNSAVVEEWALHCWEPDSGVYIDEEGTLWSSISAPAPGASMNASLLADTCVCSDTAQGACRLKPRNTTGNPRLTRTEDPYQETSIGSRRFGTLLLRSESYRSHVMILQFEILLDNVITEGIGYCSHLEQDYLSCICPVHDNSCSDDNANGIFSVLTNPYAMHSENETERKVLGENNDQHNSSSKIRSVCTGYFALSENFYNRGSSRNTLLDKYIEYDTLEDVCSERYIVYGMWSGQNEINHTLVEPASNLSLLDFWFVLFENVCFLFGYHSMLEEIQLPTTDNDDDNGLRQVLMKFCPVTTKVFLGKTRGSGLFYSCETAGNLDSNNNSSHVSTEMSQFGNEYSPRFSYKSGWICRDKHVKIVKKNRMCKARNSDSKAKCSVQSENHLILALFSSMDLPYSSLSPWAKPNVPRERNNNSGGGACLEAQEMHTERSMTLTTRTDYRVQRTRCGYRSPTLAAGAAELEAISANKMRRLHTRRDRRNMRCRPWKNPIAVPDTQFLDSQTAPVSEDMRTPTVLNRPIKVINLRNTDTKLKETPTITNSALNAAKGRVPLKHQLDCPRTHEGDRKCRQPSVPNQHDPTLLNCSKALAKISRHHNSPNMTSKITATRLKLQDMCSKGEERKSHKIHTANLYPHIKAKVKCSMPDSCLTKATRRRPSDSVSKHLLSSCVEDYEQMRRGSRTGWDTGRASHLQEQIARKVEEVVMRKAQAIVKSYQEFLESQSNQYKAEYVKSQATQANEVNNFTRNVHICQSSESQNQKTIVGDGCISSDSAHTDDFTSQGIPSNLSHNDTTTQIRTTGFENVTCDNFIKEISPSTKRTPRASKAILHNLGGVSGNPLSGCKPVYLFKAPTSNDLRKSSYSCTLSSTPMSSTNNLFHQENLQVDEHSSNAVLTRGTTTGQVVADCASFFLDNEAYGSKLNTLPDSKPTRLQPVKASNMKKPEENKLIRKSRIPVLQNRRAPGVLKDIGCEEENYRATHSSLRQTDESSNAFRVEHKKLPHSKTNNKLNEKFSPNFKQIRSSPRLQNSPSPCRTVSSKPSCYKPGVEVAPNEPWWNRSNHSGIKKQREHCAKDLNVSLNRTFSFLSEETGLDNMSSTAIFSPAKRRQLLKAKTGRTKGPVCRGEGLTAYARGYKKQIKQTPRKDSFHSPFTEHGPTHETKDLCKDSNQDKLRSSNNSLCTYFMSLWSHSMDTANIDSMRRSPRIDHRRDDCPQLVSQCGSVPQVDPTTALTGSASSSWLSRSEGTKPSHSPQVHCVSQPRPFAEPKLVPVPHPQLLGSVRKTKTTVTANHNVVQTLERVAPTNIGRIEDKQRPEVHIPAQDRKQGDNESSGDEPERSAAYSSSLSTLRSIPDLPYNNPSPEGKLRSGFSHRSSPLSDKPISASPSGASAELINPVHVDNVGAVKQTATAGQKHILRGNRPYNAVQKSRHYIFHHRNTNYSNKVCRLSISEPNLSTESEKQSSMSLRRCRSNLNMSISTSQLTFRASSSLNTCYFSGGSVYENRKCTKSERHFHPGKLSERKRSVFTRLGSGDYTSLGCDRSTFHKESSSTLTEFWSGVSFEESRTKCMNTCYNNSPSKGRSSKGSSRSVFHDNVLARDYSKESPASACDASRQGLGRKKKLRTATPWRMTLPKSIAKGKRFQNSVERSPVSNQSFTRLLKFWEKASKVASRSGVPFSPARTSSKVTRRCDKTAYLPLRRCEISREKRQIEQMSSQLAGTKSTVDENSTETSFKLRPRRLTQTRQNSKRSEDVWSRDNPNPRPIKSSGQTPKISTGTIKYKKLPHKYRSLFGKPRSFTKGKGYSSTPVYCTPKTDRMSVIYNLEPQIPNRTQRYRLFNRDNTRSQVSAQQEHRSSTVSGRTQFHSAISAQRQSPAKDALRQADLNCSESVEAFRRQRLLDFIATCCRTHEEDNHHAVSSNTLDNQINSHSGIDVQETGKVSEGMCYKADNSCKRYSFKSSTIDTSSNRYAPPKTRLKVDRRSRNSIQNDQSTENRRRDNTVKQKTRKGLKSSILQAPSRRFEPRLRVGNSPTGNHNLSQGTERSRNTVNFSPSILYISQSSDLNTTDAPSHETEHCEQVTETNEENTFTLDKSIHMNLGKGICSSGSPVSLPSVGEGYMISAGLDCSSDSSEAATPTNRLKFLKVYNETAGFLGNRKYPVHSNDKSKGTKKVKPALATNYQKGAHSLWRRRQPSNLTFISRPKKRDGFCNRSFAIGDHNVRNRSITGRTSTSTANGGEQYLEQEKLLNSLSSTTFSANWKTLKNADKNLYYHSLVNTQASPITSDSGKTFTYTPKRNVGASQAGKTSYMFPNKEAVASAVRVDSPPMQTTVTTGDQSDSICFSKTATSLELPELNCDYHCKNPRAKNAQAFSRVNFVDFGNNENRRRPSTYQVVHGVTLGDRTGTGFIKMEQMPKYSPCHMTQENKRKDALQRTELVDDTHAGFSSLENTNSSEFSQTLSEGHIGSTETVGTQTVSHNSAEVLKLKRPGLCYEGDTLEGMPSPHKTTEHGTPLGNCDIIRLAQNMNLRSVKTVAFDTAACWGKDSHSLATKMPLSKGAFDISEISNGCQKQARFTDKEENFYTSRNVFQGQPSARSDERFSIQLHPVPLGRLKLNKVLISSSDTELSYGRGNFAPKVYRYRYNSPAKSLQPVGITENVTQGENRRSNTFIAFCLVPPDLRNSTTGGSNVLTSSVTELDNFRSASKFSISKHPSLENHIKPANTSARRELRGCGKLNRKLTTKYSWSDSNLVSEGSTSQSLRLDNKTFVMPRTEKALESCNKPVVSFRLNPPRDTTKNLSDSMEAPQELGNNSSGKEELPLKENVSSDKELDPNDCKETQRTRDIEIVLGDDVTVKEFMKCFINGLDLELNNSGIPAPQTAFKKNGRVPRGSAAKPSHENPEKHSVQRGDNQMPPVVDISSRFNHSRNHTSVDLSQSQKIELASYSITVDEEEYKSPKDQQETHKKGDIQRSRQDPKYIRNCKGNFIEENTEASATDDIQAAVEGFVTDILNNKRHKPQGNTNYREKKTRKALREEHLGTEQCKMTSPRKPVRRNHKKLSPCAREQHGLGLEHVPNDNMAWWERSALTKPAVSKLPTKTFHMQRAQEQRKRSSLLWFSEKYKPHGVPLRNKKSSPEKPILKRDDIKDHVTPTLSTSETISVFFSSPHSERSVNRPSKSTNEDGQLVEKMKQKDKMHPKKCRSRKKSLPLHHYLERGKLDHDIIGGACKACARKSKSTSDIEPEINHPSLSYSYEKGQSPMESLQETKFVGVSPRKSCSVTNLYRSTRGWRSPETCRQRMQRSNTTTGKRRGKKKKSKYRSGYSSSSLTSLGAKKKKAIKDCWVKTESHCKQRLKTLSQKLMEHEIFETETSLGVKNDDNIDMKSSRDGVTSLNTVPDADSCPSRDHYTAQKKFSKKQAFNPSNTPSAKDIYRNNPQPCCCGSCFDPVTAELNNRTCVLIESGKPIKNTDEQSTGRERKDASDIGNRINFQTELPVNRKRRTAWLGTRLSIGETITAEQGKGRRFAQHQIADHLVSDDQAHKNGDNPCQCSNLTKQAESAPTDPCVLCEKHAGEPSHAIRSQLRQNKKNRSPGRKNPQSRSSPMESICIARTDWLDKQKRKAIPENLGTRSNKKVSNHSRRNKRCLRRHGMSMASKQLVLDSQVVDVEPMNLVLPQLNYRISPKHRRRLLKQPNSKQVRKSSNLRLRELSADCTPYPSPLKKKGSSRAIRCKTDFYGDIGDRQGDMESRDSSLTDYFKENTKSSKKCKGIVKRKTSPTYEHHVRFSARRMDSSSLTTSDSTERSRVDATLETSWDDQQSSVPRAKEEAIFSVAGKD
ncbi:hypothetical protein ElyMa_006848900, partial [Elysia marginata]